MLGISGNGGQVAWYSRQLICQPAWQWRAGAIARLERAGIAGRRELRKKENPRDPVNPV